VATHEFGVVITSSPGPIPAMRNATSMADDREVIPPGSGQGFGSGALKVNGKIFAMMSSKGHFVVKLSEERVNELIAAGTGARFDPGHGRLMKEWLVVTADPKLWVPLAREARKRLGK
jgi:hypothetical protein